MIVGLQPIQHRRPYHSTGGKTRIKSIFNRIAATLPLSPVPSPLRSFLSSLFRFLSMVIII